MNPDWLIQEKRRLRLVKKLVATHLKGGSCAMCGSRELEELEFHHPLKDRQYEAGLTTLSFKQIFEEMHKVVLLCATCHALLDGDRRVERVSSEAIRTHVLKRSNKDQVIIGQE